VCIGTIYGREAIILSMSEDNRRIVCKRNDCGIGL